MEKFRGVEKLAPAAALAAAGLLITSCGGDDSEPKPAAKVIDASVENDSDLTNYRLIELARFDVGGLDNAQGATFQESYDYDGKHWVCSITILDNDNGGGLGKDCTVTTAELQP